MRLHMLALTLICSFGLAAQESQEPTMIEIDSFDYGMMIQASSALLNNTFGARLQALVEKGEDIKLIPTNDEEKLVLAISYVYFLTAMTRMQQEAACLHDDANAFKTVQTIWEQGSSIFGLMPEEVQSEAIRVALQWIEEHADEAWEPSEHAELYKDSAELPALRLAAAQKFHEFLNQAIQA